MPRRYVDCKGYVRIGEHFEHRLVAAETLGRALLPGEVVHHRNGVRTDNRPENLEVMTWAEHNRHHANERRAAEGRPPLTSPLPNTSRNVQRNRNGRPKGMTAKQWLRLHRAA